MRCWPKPLILLADDSMCKPLAVICSLGKNKALLSVSIFLPKMITMMIIQMMRRVAVWCLMNDKEWSKDCMSLFVSPPSAASIL